MYAQLKSGNWLTFDRIHAYSWIILGMSMVGIVLLWSYPPGMLDHMGRPKGTDFSNPYSAGKMALNGRAAAVYDYEDHYEEQRKVFSAGEDLPFYGWHYPPIFFLIATPLSMLPYMTALVIWMVSSFLAYLAMIKSIYPDRIGLLVAAAFPAVFIVLSHGHNAFFTAACLGLGLSFIKSRPILAGILFGFLCYKPHFGLILPLVIMCGGFWRTFWAASITVLVLVSVSFYFFGWESWVAFGASLEITRTYVLEQVATGWEKIQSAFSFCRSLGCDIRTSYVVQAGVTLPTVLTLGLLWFRGLNQATCAATAAGALLITPYVLDYDLAVLSISIAFLVRNGLQEGFLPWEKTLLVFVWLVPGVTRILAMETGIPFGLLSMLLIFIWSGYRATRVAGGWARNQNAVECN